MTATQVFIRFLKEQGVYNIHFRRAIKVALINVFKRNDAENSFKSFSDKSRISCAIDIILKGYGSNLSNVLYYICIPTEVIRAKPKLHSEFQKFLKDNVKGGYRKRFISDLRPEKEKVYNLWGYSGKGVVVRNGYHKIDFEFKEKSEWYKKNQ